jgi:hypothetical protein
MTDPIAEGLERWLSHTVAVACSARRHPDAWQLIRNAWLPGAPAAASYLGEAAHPAEVREVLVALRAAYAARLPPEAPGDSEARRDFRRLRLADFVRTETDAYIARVTPPPDVRSLFAQAAAHVRPRAVAAARVRPRAVASDSAPSVTVRTCSSCGAAREADTVYGRCAFCGTAFFPRHG